MGSPRDIEEWLRSQNDLCKQTGTNYAGDPLWSAVRNGETEHVQKLVNFQKKTKRKGRNSHYLTKERKRPLDRGRSEYSSRCKSTQDHVKHKREPTIRPKYPYRPTRRRNYESNQSDQYYENPQLHGNSVIVDRSRSSETVYHNRTTVSTYDRIKCPSSKINHPTAEYEVRPKQKSDVSFTEETIETDQQSYSVRPVVTRTPSQVSRSDIYSSIPEWEKTQDDEPSTDGDTDSEDREQFIRDTRRAIEAKLMRMGESGDKSRDEKHPSTSQSKVTQWKQMSGDYQTAEKPIQKPAKKAKSRRTIGLADVQQMLRETIQNNGNEISIDYLHEIFNRDFMVQALQRKPLTLDKFRQILMRYPEDFCEDNEIIFLLNEGYLVDSTVFTGSHYSGSCTSTATSRDSCSQGSAKSLSSADTFSQPGCAIPTVTTQSTQTEAGYALDNEVFTKQLNELTTTVRQLELDIPNMERNIVQGVLDVIRKRKSRTLL